MRRFILTIYVVFEILQITLSMLAQSTKPHQRRFAKACQNRDQQCRHAPNGITRIEKLRLIILKKYEDATSARRELIANTRRLAFLCMIHTPLLHLHKTD